AVLQRAYPGNVPSVDYYPLLVVLQEDMSARNLAAVVAELVDGETAVVDNDAAAAVSVRRPPPRDVERVRTHLLSNGWIPEED
ncbi:MAG TPA: DUF3349 domain-containing protein, partial [Actinoplanes sp.]